jgi:hypothetical protein
MRKRGAALRRAQAEIEAEAAGPELPPVEVAAGSKGAVAKAGAGRAEAERPPIPEFAPAPRKYRHDGWTPERQKAFVEALADCGSVRRAAAMVNMSNENAYVLRRSPGAEEFRRAWDAAATGGHDPASTIAAS